jgi:hypothetical protein
MSTKPVLGFLAAAAAVGTGVFLALRKSRGANLGGATEIRELQLFCENDGALYRQQVQPIEANLTRKLAKGVYDHEKSVKLWTYLADNCAKKYAKEFGDGTPWHKMFSTSDRRAVARAFADSWKREHVR